jgi:hypothetical protein
VPARRVLVLLALLPLHASAALGDWEWTREVESRALSRFVQHGVERARESLQIAGWLRGDAVKLGTWTNFPLGDTRSHEFALAAAAKHRWESGTQIDFDVTHYHLRDARDGHPGHTAELTLALSHPVGPGRVVASWLRDVNRHADLAEVAYAGEHPLPTLGAFLHYRLYLGTKAASDVLPNLPGPRVADSYSYHGADLSLPYRIGGATILELGVHYAGTVGQRPFWSPTHAPVRGKGWATLAARVEF